MKSVWKTVAVIGMLAVPAAHADSDQLIYNAWGMSYVKVNPDGPGGNAEGFSASLTGELTEKVFVYGAYADVSIYGITEKDYGLGLGYAWPLRDNLDVVGTAGYQAARLKGYGESFNDDAYRVSLGLRGRFFDRLEVEGGVAYIDFDKVGDSTGGFLGAQWFFIDSVAITASLGYTESATTWGVGFRGVWGRTNKN